MLVVFLAIFAADTKLIFGHDFVAPLMSQLKIKPIYLKKDVFSRVSLQL